MEVEHFSHRHPLTLSAEQLHVDDGEVICSCCEKSILGPSYYTCRTCSDFFLHKECFELPREIKHLLHSEHPLYLVLRCSSGLTKYRCDLCNKTLNGFAYHCPRCDFDLDIQCACPPCSYDGEHRFRCLLNSLSFKSLPFTCSACGTDGDACPFMCTMCQLTVHEECISLPRTIETSMHSHRRLIYTFHLQHCESVRQYCGFCRLEVDTNYGGYHCPDCDFVAHAKCGELYEGENEGEEESEGEEGEQSITRYNEFMEPAYTVVREIQHGEEKMIAEIKHFSHQHNLIFIDRIFDDHLKCDGCMLLISTPFYGCTECNYFLDKTCIELPRQKKLQYHRHPLTLIPMAKGDNGFICDSCHEYCHGFRYTCERDGLSFDVRCLDILKESSIKHTGHKHPLFFAAENENYHCGSCGVEDDGHSGSFRCIDCDFNLDPACAVLPHKARHKYDDHPLFLTSVDPNTYEFVCLICEKHRDPKLWFYRCEECDFDAHPRCALGKYPFVKFGNAHTYGFHPHPLALVDKTDSYPGDNHRACCNCGRSCDDLALECTDSECDFIIHGKERDCWDPNEPL